MAAAGKRRPKFEKGDCGIFLGSSGTRADIHANSRFEVGYGMLPTGPKWPAHRKTRIIGGATLWVLNDRPSTEYEGVAKFFAFLSRPETQAAWHQNTGSCRSPAPPSTSRARRDSMTAIPGRDRDRADTSEAADRGVAGNAAWIVCPDSWRDRRRTRTGFAGKKPSQAALDPAVDRGNELLPQFERANPDR